MSSREPLVTVVMPMYNAELFVRRAFAQVEALNYTNLEIVIINDGSTDKTISLIASWSHETSLAHKIITNKASIGVSASRNKAVEVASGEYLWFTDCDDKWSPEIVRHLMTAIDESNAQIAICNAYREIDGTDRRTLIEDAPSSKTLGREQALQHLLLGSIQGHLWNKIFSKALFSSNTFPNTRAHSDLGGMLSLLSDSKMVVLSPGVYYTYLVRKGSILNSKDYRWDDLNDCARIALNRIRSLGPSNDLRFAFLVFLLGVVHIPLSNEKILRKNISVMPAWYADMLNMKNLTMLFLRGYHVLVLKTLFLKFAPGIYSFVYRKYRIKRWGNIRRV